MIVFFVDDGEGLDAALQSILKQPVDDLEVLIVSDEHNGKALEDVRGLLADSRIRLVSASGVESVIDACKAGLAHAKGEYVAFLDTDSVFEEGALGRRLAFLRAYPEVELVHGATSLMNAGGDDLGVTVGRRRNMTFDAAMHPTRLHAVMGTVGLMKKAASFEGNVAHGEWRYFAQMLRSGVTSHYVAQGGAMLRLRHVPTVEQELADYDDAVRHIVDWLYEPDGATYVAPQYRAGLARPVRRVARRQCQFPLFVWGLVSGNLPVCRTLLDDQGFAAYLNTFTINSMADEVQAQCTRHYLVDAKDQLASLDGATKSRILRGAEQSGVDDLAPTLYFALCLALGVTGRFGGAWRPIIADPPLFEPGHDSAVDADLSVVTTFRTNGDAEAVRDCVKVLLENCANPWIQSVHVLLEGDMRHLDESIDAAWVAAIYRHLQRGKLVFSPIHARPSYKQIFDYANTLGQRIVAVINADIVVPPEAARQIVQSRKDRSEPAYVLSRWNETPDGVYLQAKQESPPWPQWLLEERSFLERHCRSYDCYVFDAPFAVPTSLDTIFIGTAGCDWAIVAGLRLIGVPLQNPCLTIRTIHHDNKPKRDYHENGRAQRDLANCVRTFYDDLLARLSVDDPLSRSLNALHLLERNAAWLGGPGCMNVRETLFHIASHVVWEQLGEGRQFSHVTIPVSRGDVNTAKDTILALADDIMDNRVFITWQLSGFPHGGHIGDLLVDHVDLEAVGYALFRYSWQTMVHLDRAGREAESVLQDIQKLVLESWNSANE